MSFKTVLPRTRAYRDIDDIVSHYLTTGGDDVAHRFVVSLETAYRQISRYPASGSPRYAYDLEIADLRFWPLKRFPFLMFYIEQDTYIDVLRVLHGQSDIPLWLRDSG